MESTHSRQDISIIADDLGLLPSVNEGIFFALKNRLIDGASLMANGEAFDHAVRQCLENKYENIGIHLVLVEEKPITSMFFPKNHKTFFVKYLLGIIKLSDVENELRAQLSRMTSVGVKPAFINSHQHLHLLPGIMNVIIKLAKEFEVHYIRLVTEPIFFGEGSLFRRAQLLFLNFLSWLAKGKIEKAGLRHNDFFVGFLSAGNLG